MCLTPPQGPGEGWEVGSSGNFNLPKLFLEYLEGLERPWGISLTPHCGRSDIHCMYKVTTTGKGLNTPKAKAILSSYDWSVTFLDRKVLTHLLSKP